MAPRKKAAAKPTPHMSVADAMANVNAIYPGALTMASDPELAVLRWPTGVAPLDAMLDGGIPRGRFIEVYGPYSVLKSWWAYKALAAVQKAGGRIALIDTEHSWDAEWGEQCGIDTKKMMVGRPQNAEEGIGILEALIRQKYDLIVFDSIASAIPKQHQESLPGEDNQPGALARVMSKGLARLNAANKHSAVIFINQTREKIGVTFGSPVTTSGGKAMGFYASYRLSFMRTGKITDTVKQWDGEKMVDAKRVLAHKIKATLEKSKLSAPHVDCLFTYDLSTGEVDTVGWLIGQGIEKGLIDRSSSGHHQIADVMDKPIHGAAAFRKWVNENEAVVEWLTKELIPVARLASPTTG